MENLIIKEHISSNYQDRTKFNAEQADLTVAFAIDLLTSGELCTRKFAKQKYVGIQLKFNLNDEYLFEQIINKILLKKNELDAHILNIAGNGIYTLHKHKINQEQIDSFILKIITKINSISHISQIITGGQTGVDIAGAKAGYILNIPTIVTFPKGFRQRFEDGKDITQTYEDIINQITINKIKNNFNI